MCCSETPDFEFTRANQRPRVRLGLSNTTSASFVCDDVLRHWFKKRYLLILSIAVFMFVTTGIGMTTATDTGMTTASDAEKEERRLARLRRLEELIESIKNLKMEVKRQYIKDRFTRLARLGKLGKIASIILADSPLIRELGQQGELIRKLVRCKKEVNNLKADANDDNNDNNGYYIRRRKREEDKREIGKNAKLTLKLYKRTMELRLKEQDFNAFIDKLFNDETLGNINDIDFRYRDNRDFVKTNSLRTNEM